MLDVKLTQEEEQQALRIALNAKRARVAAERQRTNERILRMNRQLTPPTTPVELWEQLFFRGREKAYREEWGVEFMIPHHSRDIYQSLCFYFTGDLRMEDYGLSGRKGLMMYGNVGSGKTVMMDLFARNNVQSYKLVSCEQIEAEYRRGKGTDATLEKYSQMLYNEYKQAYYGQSYLGYCFDDFGSEKTSVNYGDVRELMYNILTARYNSVPCKGPRTHLTSNLTLEMIAQRYNERLIDRLKQMFNLIEFPSDAPSLRG